MFSRLLLLSILLLGSTPLLGCLRTEISIPLQPGIDRLASVTKNALPYSVIADDKETTVGRQFVLFILPFGRVAVPSPRSLTVQSLFTHAAIKGYRPVEQNGDELKRGLEIEVKDISVFGYDFLFFRRPVASVQLRARLRSPSGNLLRESEVVGTSSDFTKFAFDKDLSRVLEEAMDKAFEQTFTQLGLS